MTDSSQSGAALFAFDEELQVVAWNEAAEELTGFSAADALGRPCYELFAGVDDGGGTVCGPDCGYAKAMFAGRVPPGPAVRIRTRGGRRRRVAFSLLSAVGTGGERHYFHLIRPLPSFITEEAPGPPVTDRQREVLALLAEGVRVREVAARLGISETTVRNHIRRTLGRLGCHSQLQAVVKARRLGLI